MNHNPTIAKELALLFVEKTGQQPTSSNMPRTVKVIKELLTFGYTVEEVEYAINYAVKYNKNIYSVGYIKTIIDKAIQQKEKEELASRAEEVVVKVITKESEVEQKDDIAERNRHKSTNFGVQSRLRAKSYFDLFEGE